VAWRASRKSFRAELYWGRQVPGWGDPEPSMLIVGLAPAAHGGNRTGRVFTGEAAVTSFTAAASPPDPTASPPETASG
jgi:uracil-DNA glycosylase